MSLETRRTRADLIETFKIFNNFDDIDPALLFKLHQDTGTRGHPFKLFKHQCRLDIRKFSFTNRVANIWNTLPLSAVQAKTINEFKSHIDPLLKSRGGGDFISQKRLFFPPTRPTDPNFTL